MAEVAFTPGTLDITWPQGTRLGLVFTAPVGYPDDFTATDTVIRSTWRYDEATGAVALELSSAGSYLEITGARTFVYNVPATVMAGLGTPGESSTLVHDIEIVPGGVEANAYMIARGTITLEGESTR